MNILVIGNGFDLAHGLPTKYTDFLYFCNVVKEIIKGNKLNGIIPQENGDYTEWVNGIDKIKDLNFGTESYKVFFVNILNLVSERDDEAWKEIYEKLIKKRFLGGDINQKWIKEVLYLIFDNIWIEYFLQYEMHDADNWIDFESEISKVIETMSSVIKEQNINFYETERNFKNGNTYYLNPEYYKILNIVKKCKKRNEENTYLEIRNYLLEDLEKLVRTLEMYLTDYVEKIEISKISKDIKELDIDHVLSFNYTDTFEKMYGRNNYIEYDYIHGKANINSTIESNNMVLGINEYLDDDRKNKDVEFIAFKKYYQRIHKQTGCKYKEWVDDIRESWEKESEENVAEIRRCISKNELENEKIHKLYIFGHSLDITDKDILCDLILNDNVHTTIFYHNKDVMGQQIANLVKVIGQDKLIKRTGGSTKTIEFRQQQDMLISSSTVIY